MKLINRWAPAVLWMGIIFLLSSRQRLQVSPEPTLNFLVFKTLHVLEYAVLFFLLVRARWRKEKPGEPSPYLEAFVLTVVYAMTDEVHQTFVPTREGKFRDGIIDAIGASLAWMILHHIQHKAPRKLQRLLTRLLVS